MTAEWTAITVAIITTLGMIIAGYITTQRKLNKIHVLVNSRLQLALEEITMLRRMVERLAPASTEAKVFKEERATGTAITPK